jgi:hypothetical protein
VVVVGHVGPAAGRSRPRCQPSGLAWWHYGLGCRTRHKCFLMMSRLGHATPSMSLRYQHAITERDTAIADRLGALMRAVEQQPVEVGAEVRSIGK